MAHDQRRRIVGALTAPSYAGFASVIASLIASLGQRGMAVLAVDRAGQIIPAPDAETLLLPGDRLICYGKVKRHRVISLEQVGPFFTVGLL